MHIAFAIAGLLAALALSLIDFVTSYNGVRAIIPWDTGSLILKSIPILFCHAGIDVQRQFGASLPALSPRTIRGIGQFHPPGGVD